MVGHSGMLEPTIKAVEAVDECLGKVVDAIIEKVALQSLRQTTEMQMKY